MLKVLNYIPVGNNLAVTVDGVCSLKAGDILTDENGNKFRLVSVGMARYNNPKDIKKFTDILVSPNAEIGKTLVVS